MRTCTMPVGTQLFFPLVNAAFLPFPDETEEDLQNQANAYLDEQLANSDWEITVDGKELKPNRLVRAVTPFFTVNVPEDGLFGLAPGEYQLVAGGLWVTLPPLPPGEHTVHFEITGGSFDQDVTYHLKVVNRKSAP